MFMDVTGNTYKDAGARATSERLCYYCLEGHCAQCNGWDRTIVDGKIIEIACAHGCHQLLQRKPNGKADAPKVVKKRA